MVARTCAFLLALLLSGGCATGAGASSGYTHISDPGLIFAAADWTADVAGAVNAAGWSARADEIRAHMNEAVGWPASLKDEDARWRGGDILKSYNVREIARLSFHGQPAVLLHAPAAANQRMPAGWRPEEDFFIVASPAAMAPAP